MKIRSHIWDYALGKRDFPMVVGFKHIEKWTIMILKTQKEGFDSPTGKE